MRSLILALAVVVCLPSAPASAAQMRILSVDPLDPSPAERAVDDLNRVARNRCDGPGRTRSRRDEEVWSGGMYAPGCENPPRRITTRHSIVEPGERFAIFGDFGERRRDEVLALMDD